MYVPNIRHNRIYKTNTNRLKGRNGNNKIILGDFKTTVVLKNRSSFDYIYYRIFIFLLPKDSYMIGYLFLLCF